MIDLDSWKQTDCTSITSAVLKENVSYWIPQPGSMTYSIGRPDRFPTEFPYYLPVEYMNLTHPSSPHEYDLASLSFVGKQDPALLIAANKSVDPRSIIRDVPLSDASEAEASDDGKESVLVAPSSNELMSRTETMSTADGYEGAGSSGEAVR